jgi:ABC-type Co2+ transport system permease subunit
MGKLSEGKYIEIFVAMWAVLIMYGLIVGLLGLTITLTTFFAWLIWALINQAIVSAIITGVVWAVVEKTK